MYVARAYPHVFQTLPLAYNLPGVTGNVGRYGLGSGSLCVVEGCASLLQIDMLKVISPWQHYDEYKFDALVLHFDMNPKPYMVSRDRQSLGISNSVRMRSNTSTFVEME